MLPYLMRVYFVSVTVLTLCLYSLCLLEFQAFTKLQGADIYYRQYRAILI